MLKIKNQNQLPLNVDLTKVYTELGETSADLQDAKFVVKDEAQENIILTKTLAGGGIVVNAIDANKLDIQLNPINDYGVGFLEVGKTYRFFFGIKTTNVNTVFLEVNFKDNTIKIIKDGIND